MTFVKTLLDSGQHRMTVSAVAGAQELGFDRTGVVQVVMALTPADFYKSMTTYSDHTIWQDVYRPMTVAGRVYFKLTVIALVVIVSFKEL